MTAKERFQAFLADREFVFLDGAMGTMLQSLGLDLGKLPEALNITHPEAVTSIHKQYIDAGSDIIYSCSFGVSDRKTEGTAYTTEQLIGAAVANARKAAEGTETLVALDIGPLGVMMEPYGTLSFEDAYGMFQKQVLAGKGADLIVIETMTDLREARCALLAARENTDLPVMVTLTFEENRRTFTGTQLSAMALVLEGLGADAIGINCSLGPKEFIPMIEELSRWTTLPIIAKPNAGLPDPSTGEYPFTPEEFAEGCTELIPYGVKLVGGCCGSDPRFVAALKRAFRGKTYCKQDPSIPSAVCSPEATVVIDQPRIIGERINPTGKKKLKEAYKNGDYEYIQALAAEQTDAGAEILDVNAGVPGIDERDAMLKAVWALAGVTTAPLQIDSGNPEVLEAALRIYPGKAIVNSVNGEERSLSRILPVVKKYGAAVVGLTLDEEGIPKDVATRLAIASRILQRAEALGIPKRDIYIDCLTLTVSAEQENASNTLFALRKVKEDLGLRTALGVSNISFGLPNRPMINKNFLQMALMSGLDLPIINPSDAEMVRAVDVYRLIMNIDKGAASYIEKYAAELSAPAAGGAPGQTVKNAGPEPGTLGYAIANGLAAEAKALTFALLKEKDPIAVINEDLIPVLDRAGEEFEKGRIFIPQLILTATTAQSAFDAVKETIQASGARQASEGKIVVATVKGDIHDIGKNIVKVILENYGYEMIDLGKDVDPELIADTVVAQDCRLLGLSALMTTTLGSMEETIALVKKRAPHCRIMAGGAVLTEDYALRIGADFYVKDAKASADRAKEVFG